MAKSYGSYTIRPTSADQSEPVRLTPTARLGRALAGLFTFVGLRRPRKDDGTLGPRAWRRGLIFAGAVVVIWLLATMIHIVQAGNVGVPVTLGRAGGPVGAGFHISLPFTAMKQMSVRTTSYTMAAEFREGARADDDSVLVLGSDGASGSVDSTILYRLDASRATEVYRELGIGYLATLIRPSARTCIRSVFTDHTMVEAVTTAWHDMEVAVAVCVKEKVEPNGIFVIDFQLREVRLDATLQGAVTAKVSAQQESERQQFELSKARQQAEITRVEALATADSQQILACGGQLQSVEQADGTVVLEVVPNPIDQCSQAQLTPAYLQFTYIQALKALVNSPNNSTIILPFDQALTPLIDVSGGSNNVLAPPDTSVTSTTTTSTTTTTVPGG
jgi:regulator of protease activity HflC (stomatin/prohibitin superfamily)